MRGRIAGALLFLAVAAYRLTLRIRVVGDERRRPVTERGRPLLHALWHQRMIPGILRYPYRGMATMASRSEDGAIIATFLALWGFRVARGSSSRGGAQALRELIERLRGTTGWAALTPDGPRGPARRAKPGLLLLAEALDAPIVPTGTSSTRPVFLKSWDRYLVPRPFSRCVVYFGEPVERRAGEEEPAFLARLESALDAATEEADRLCGVAEAPRAKLAEAR